MKQFAMDDFRLLQQRWFGTTSTQCFTSTQLRAVRATSYGDLQQACGVLVINLLQNRLRQTDAVNPPASLRRHFGRSIVEILVVGLEKSVIDFVQLVVECLLWGFV